MIIYLYETVNNDMSVLIEFTRFYFFPFGDVINEKYSTNV